VRHNIRRSKGGFLSNPSHPPAFDPNRYKASLDQAGKKAAWEEIAMELQRFESSSGFEGPCERIVVSGSASG
jgi:hypothetical protein